MQFKFYNDEKLYLSKLVEYDGPITLAYYPEKTIINMMGKYIINIEAKYFEVLEVIYLGQKYKFDLFVKLNKDVLYI